MDSHPIHKNPFHHKNIALWLSLMFLLISLGINISYSQDIGQKSFDFPSIKANQTVTMDIADIGYELSSVSMTLSKEENNAKVTIRRLEAPIVANPSEQVNSIYAVDFITILPTDISNAKISFMIKDEWLQTNALFPADILLQTYEGGGWVKHTPKYEGFSEGYRIYSAEISSLGTFVITSSRIVSSQPDTVRTKQVPLEPRRPAPIALLTPAIEQKQSLFSGNLFGNSELFLAALVMVLLIGSVAIFRYNAYVQHEESIRSIVEEVKGLRHGIDHEEGEPTKILSEITALKPEKKDEELLEPTKKADTRQSKLIDFIHKELSKGYSEEYVRNILTKNKWPADMIENAFSEISKHKTRSHSGINSIQFRIIAALSAGMPEKDIREEISEKSSETDVNEAFRRVHELDELIHKSGLHEKHHDIPESKEIVKSILDKGYTKKILKEALKAAGWKEHNLDEVL